MDLNDIQSLVELLRRTPMTKAEQLFSGRLVETLMTFVAPGDDEDAGDNEPK